MGGSTGPGPPMGMCSMAKRREGGQHAAPTAYASLGQSRPWKARKRQPSNAPEARGRQGFGGHAASSQRPMRCSKPQILPRDLGGI